MARLMLAMVLVFYAAATAAAQQAVFVVRHAERADAGAMAAPMMASDPDLSEAGRARAQSLAAMLKDAGITAIYTTEYKRTRQTAEPLAKALGIEATVVPAREMPSLVEKVKAATGNVLVVGHSNTVGDVVTRLGAGETVKVGDNEYDNLFIVLRTENPALVRLRYK
ncbi:MAG TPA: phosphoglycerate mutase family protein [Vicinamibacterales bacterium]|nr:phosphoglycerate mutase family protein [Vicinamibacterales bacterium]